MWTDEQKKLASEKAKARWANPEYKKSQGDAIKSPPCCPKCGETDIAKFYVDKKVAEVIKFAASATKKDVWSGGTHVLG